MVNVMSLHTRTFRDSLHFALKFVKNFETILSWKIRSFSFIWKLWFLRQNLARLLLDFLNNFPKRFYSNYAFFKSGYAGVWNARFHHQDHFDFVKHLINVYCNLLEGCVHYIFTSLFFMSKWEHVWNKEKMFFISLRKLFSFLR